MVLQAILGSSYSNRRNTSRSRSRAKSPSVTAAVNSNTGAADDTSSSPDDAAITNAGYIDDEAQLRRLPPECPDLRDLNNSLEALAVVFPDVQVEVFREMLAHFDGESRLYVVADELLKNRVNWVKGRWRVVENNQVGNADEDGAVEEEDPAVYKRDYDGNYEMSRRIPPKEAFRSDEYQKAVKALAWHEFRGLPRSTIHAVLAESNYDYLDARNTLVDLSSKSWRFSISAFFFSRRRPTAASAPPQNIGNNGGGNDAENHPLVTWKSTGQGSIVPTVRATGSPELDRELYNRLVRPLRRQARVAQEEKDREMANLLNADEAEREGALYECCCCYTDAPFEEFVQCDADGAHMMCFGCVRRSLSEAVFGQGWRRSVDHHAGTLRCLAVDGCERGRVPVEHLRRAMRDEKKGADILRRLDRRLAEHSLLASGLPLVRCPFCDYAEVDDVYLPRGESRLRLRLDSLFNLFFILVCMGTIPLLLPLVLTSSLAALLLVLCSRLAFEVASHSGGSSNNNNNNDNNSSTNPASPTTTTATNPLSACAQALNRHRRRRRGAKFTCRDPACGQTSCLSCHKAWADVHVCNESSLVALRTQVEQAMSLAVKRVCPRCGTSFVKNSGCNKLTCPCGYKMCYVCRKDIGSSSDGEGGGGEGYRHFCDHFRPEGDPTPCTQCDRCNLWESEDTDAVLREAKEEAERKWREMEERGEKGLSGSEKRFLETGYASGGGGGAAAATASAAGSADLSLDGLVRRGRLPTVAELCDVFIEHLFV